MNFIEFLLNFFWTSLSLVVCILISIFSSINFFEMLPFVVIIFMVEIVSKLVCMSMAEVTG